MNELTPEQRELQEKIRLRVKFLKFVRTHIRLASLVVQFVGLLTNVPILIWGGLIAFLFSYAWAVSIMEEITLLIWDSNEPKEETEENDDQQSQ